MKTLHKAALIGVVIALYSTAASAQLTNQGMLDQVVTVRYAGHVLADGGDECRDVPVLDAGHHLAGFHVRLHGAA